MRVRQNRRVRSRVKTSAPQPSPPRDGPRRRKTLQLSTHSCRRPRPRLSMPSRGRSTRRHSGWTTRSYSRRRALCATRWGGRLARPSLKRKCAVLAHRPWITGRIRCRRRPMCGSWMQHRRKRRGLASPKDRRRAPDMSAGRRRHWDKRRAPDMSAGRRRPAPEWWRVRRHSLAKRQ